jgi:hypothetical protein
MRFPADFLFLMSLNEVQELRRSWSQMVTLKRGGDPVVALSNPSSFSRSQPQKSVDPRHLKQQKW